MVQGDVTCASAGNMLSLGNIICFHPVNTCRTPDSEFPSDGEALKVGEALCVLGSNLALLVSV